MPLGKEPGNKSRTSSRLSTREASFLADHLLCITREWLENFPDLEEDNELRRAMSILRSESELAFGDEGTEEKLEKKVFPMLQAVVARFKEEQKEVLDAIDSGVLSFFGDQDPASFSKVNLPATFQDLIEDFEALRAVEKLEDLAYEEEERVAETRAAIVAVDDEEFDFSERALPNEHPEDATVHRMRDEAWDGILRVVRPRMPKDTEGDAI